jgi:cyanate permease
MTRLLTAIMVLLPGAALAHTGTVPHAHPHGLEIVLGAFAVIAAASVATWRLNAARQRRDRDR